MGNFLVTGSSGYVGAQVVHSLRARNHSVVGVDLQGSDYNCDLSTEFILPKQLSSKETILVHLAAKFPGTAPSQGLLAHSRSVSRNLLSFAENFKAVVLISSSAVYRRALAEGIPVVEPWEAYGRAKLEMENDFSKHNFNLSILRPGTILGPGRVGGIVNLLKASVSGGLTILPFSGNVTHPFVHVNDVVQSILQQCVNLDKLSEKKSVMDLIASDPITISRGVELLSGKKPFAPRLPSAMFRYLGLDFFPVAGISKWHAGALLYDFADYKGTAYLGNHTMLETIKSVIV